MLLINNITKYFNTKHHKKYFVNDDDGLTTKFFVSKELAKFCNINYKIPVIRFNVLKQIYEFLKDEFYYTNIYYGESHELNKLINFNPDIDEQMSHNILFRRLLIHFRQ